MHIPCFDFSLINLVYTDLSKFSVSLVILSLGSSTLLRVSEYNKDNKLELWK